jgi:RimJ/RimL family protein N-acetyltransferase
MTVAALQNKFTSAEISLRQTVEADSQQIWAWRNDPEVRAISFSLGVIDWNSHEQWIRNKLADSGCLWLIAEHSELGTIGHIRFELMGDRQSLVAVTIAANLRGRGIGKILIGMGVKEAFAKLPIDRILAQIKPHNVASETAFRQLGFRPIAPTTINGCVARQLVLDRTEANSMVF